MLEAKSTIEPLTWHRPCLQSSHRSWSHSGRRGGLKDETKRRDNPSGRSQLSICMAASAQLVVPIHGFDKRPAAPSLQQVPQR